MFWFFFRLFFSITSKHLETVTVENQFSLHQMVTFRKAIRPHVYITEVWKGRWEAGRYTYGKDEERNKIKKT